MERHPALFPLTETAAALARTNGVTCRYGLQLTERDVAMLLTRRAEALRDTGRVEFLTSILPKLTIAFCDSPYLFQDAYADTLSELTGLFYELKNDLRDLVPDDELLCRMRAAYDDAGGSTDAVADLCFTDLTCFPSLEETHDEINPAKN